MEKARRQVFLSFLGTSDYVEVHYCMNDYESKLVRFIQESAVELFLKDKQDNLPYKIYIFCTKESESKNWRDDGHKDRFENPLKREGLSTRLRYLFQEQGLDESNIEMIIIPEGFNEEEIWQLFNTVYDVLEEGDEITFDMTHSFRSIPLFSTVLFNYARVMKGVEVRKLYYGAFEKLGPSYLVKDMPKKERLAPIIDMTGIVDLQKTTIAASDFIKFGKMSSLGEFLQSADIGLTPRQQEKISQFDNILATNRINQIKEGRWKSEFEATAKHIREKYKTNNPQTHLLNKMADNIKDFSASPDFKNIETAIEWAMKYHQVIQAYTICQEYAITRIEAMYDEELKDTILPDYHLEDDMDERERKKETKRAEKQAKVDRRNFVSGILAISDKDIDNGRFMNLLGVGEYALLRDKMLSDDFVNKVRQYFDSLTAVRNELNHGKPSQRNFIEQMNMDIPHMLSILRSMDMPVEKDIIPKPQHFLNLSNHPSSTWDEKQIEAAEKYGPIEDMEFPKVSPEASEEEIVALVDDYAEKIIAKSEVYDLTVHVMGEMTFTLGLVSRLKEQGIRCVASTTTRETIDKGNGVKESAFGFVRFREY